MKPPLKPTAIFFAILTLVCLIFGCATDSGDAAKDRRGRVTNAVLKTIFVAALNFGVSEGQSYLEGQNGQDAAHAAFLAADKGLISSSTINDLVTAYAGPQVGQVAAQQFTAANPQTPAESKAVANTIGAAFQEAANQNNPPPAPQIKVSQERKDFEIARGVSRVLSVTAPIHVASNPFAK